MWSGLCVISVTHPSSTHQRCHPALHPPALQGSTLPFFKHSSSAALQGLCHRCSSFLQCSSPHFPMAGSFLSFMFKCRLLREASLVTYTQVPTRPSAPHRCFIFVLTFSKYFLVCYVAVTAVCQSHIYHINKDPAGPLHLERSSISSTYNNSWNLAPK